MRGSILSGWSRGLILGSLAFILLAPPSEAGDLFENLKGFGSFTRRLKAGDPNVRSTWESGREGPKGIAAGDLDGDGEPDLAITNLDGTVTVYLDRSYQPAEPIAFSDPIHLHTQPFPGESETLRGIVIADFNGDRFPDIAAASPQSATVYIFWNDGNGDFGAPEKLRTWPGAREVAAMQLQPGGPSDLVVAGDVVAGDGKVRQYRHGPGGFETLADLPVPRSREPEPHFSLKAFRPPGETQDELVVTHADSNLIWVLGADVGGTLQIKATISVVRGIHSLDVAPLTSRIGSGGLPDLAMAYNNAGIVEVRRGVSGPARFDSQSWQTLRVGGGPRALRLLDMDGDRWNDLAVVLQDEDLVLAFGNDGQGKLHAATRMPVGVSPRELVAADFNLDGRPDLAVMNRDSQDVSILRGYEGQVGFAALDGFYLVDGEVAALAVADLNGDGKKDVIQLHRASADLSVRFADSGGSGLLGPPSFYPVGPQPSALAVVDVNGDGLLDALTANLGQGQGSISVLLGDRASPSGQLLLPEKRLGLPSGVKGGLFSLQVADFDGDGLPDLVAGFLDCRLGFIKGTGNWEQAAGGTGFAFAGNGPPETGGVFYFIYESRAMAVGDFDRDGDLDLAGAGYAGDLVVLENHQEEGRGLLSSRTLFKQLYPTADPERFGTLDLKAGDVDLDGWTDLVMGSGSDGILYLNRGSAPAAPAECQTCSECRPCWFRRPAEGTLGSSLPFSNVLVADFDGDGQVDVAASCDAFSCIEVFTRDPGGRYAAAVSIDVPAGRFLAAGDIDGDGKEDLIGSGQVLWTALSSRGARLSGPRLLESRRDANVVHGPVINEILAINNSLPVALDGGRSSDWLEIFNGSETAVSLAGYSLTKSAGGFVESFQFPPLSTLDAGAHLLLIAARSRGLGFKLPAEGATLALKDSAGHPVDQVTYPPQHADISYGRFQDGLPAFVFKSDPTPEAPNLDSRTLPPLVKLEGAMPQSSLGKSVVPPFQPAQPIRFLARSSDDVGVVSVSLRYRRIDLADQPLLRAIFYDDGISDDDEAQDGRFGGLLKEGLPAGGEIELYLEARDMSGNMARTPDLPDSDIESGSGTYSIAVGVPVPPLELFEVVANRNGELVSPPRPDLVVIRNTSAKPASLTGVFLGQTYPADEKWFSFPGGETLGTLGPGERLVVICDGNGQAGTLHAPFKLNADGDSVFLVGTGPRGGKALIDGFKFGFLPPDTSWRRVAPGGAWAQAQEGVAGDVDGSGTADITDVIQVLNFLFLGGSLHCREAGDTNLDGEVDLTDAIYLANYLYLGGPPPAAARCP